MDDAKPSLVRRALAFLVLVVVAVVAVKIVVGVVSAIFWIVAVVALIIAALWAMSTLKSGRRERAKEPQRSVKPAPAARMPVAAPEDRVEAQMRQIKQQLRDQGRL
jgi:Ca2+/Na+ antiporter